eukprot:g11117.t1
MPTSPSLLTDVLGGFLDTCSTNKHALHEQHASSSSFHSTAAAKTFGAVVEHESPNHPALLFDASHHPPYSSTNKTHSSFLDIEHADYFTGQLRRHLSAGGGGGGGAESNLGQDARLLHLDPTKPLIFQDVDGVLNDADENVLLSDKLINRLDDLVGDTDAQIRIVGATPSLCRGVECRAKEIWAWMEGHKAFKGNWVALDDWNLFVQPDGEHLVDHFVNTNPDVGLTPDDAEEATRLLDRPVMTEDDHPPFPLGLGDSLLPTSAAGADLDAGVGVGVGLGAGAAAASSMGAAAAMNAGSDTFAGADSFDATAAPPDFSTSAAAGAQDSSAFVAVPPMTTGAEQGVDEAGAGATGATSALFSFGDANNVGEENLVDATPLQGSTSEGAAFFPNAAEEGGVVTAVEDGANAGALSNAAAGDVEVLPAEGAGTGAIITSKLLASEPAGGGASRRSQRRHDAKKCELFKMFLRDEAKHFIQETERAKVPSMIAFYSSDGTPMRTAEVLYVHGVKRYGKAGKEWLIERMLVSDGETFRPVFTDGRLLEEQRQLDVVAAALELPVSTLREEGYSGLCTTLYCHDRGKRADVSLKSLWHKRHKWVFASHRVDPRPGVDMTRLELTDFSIYSSCFLHDTHGAGEKSTTPASNRLGDNKKARDACHNITVSLRGAYSYLFMRLSSWVFSRVDFISECEKYDHETQRLLFTIMDIDPEIIEAFALLGFSVKKSGRVTIFAKYATSPWLVEMLGSAPVITFKFVTFCLTRWLSVRRSAGRLAFAWYLGLDELVKLVVKEEKGASFATAAYRKNISSEARFFAITTLVSMVPASRLEQLLMKDDRLLVHFEKYKREFLAARRWVLNLPDTVWVELEAIVGDTDLRTHVASDVRGGVLCSFAYLQRLAFDALEELPLCLAIVPAGVEVEAGITSNLQQLRDMELAELQGEDLTTRKIWACLRPDSGVGMSDLVGQIEKWRHFPFTAKLVEDGHGAFASAKKGHTGYNAQTVQQKGFHRSFTSCQEKSSIDPRTKDIKKLEEYIDALDAKQPSQLRRFHVAADDEAKKYIRTRGTVPDFEERQKIRGRANTKVESLTANEKIDFDDRLAKMVQQARSDIASLKAQAYDMIFNLRSSISTEEKPGLLGEKLQMRLGNVNYKKEAVQKYLDENGPSLSHMQAAILRARARMCPNPVDAVAISSLDETEPCVVRLMPRWARIVIERRGELLLSLFRFADASSTWYALATWIKANPQEIVFEVVREHVDAPAARYCFGPEEEVGVVADAHGAGGAQIFIPTEQVFYETDEVLHTVSGVEVAECDFLLGGRVLRTAPFGVLDNSVVGAAPDLEEKAAPQAQENTSRTAKFAREHPGLAIHLAQHVAQELVPNVHARRVKATRAEYYDVAGAPEQAAEDESDGTFGGCGAGGDSALAAPPPANYIDEEDDLLADENGDGVVNVGPAAVPASSSSSSSSSSGSVRPAAERLRPCQDMSPGAADDVRRTLKEAREAEKERANSIMRFYPTPKGGPANLRAGGAGILIVAYHVKCNDAGGAAFLEQLNQPASKHYYLSKYGEAAASLLCYHYCRRVSFLYNLRRFWGKNAAHESQIVEADEALAGLAQKDPKVQKALDDINAVSIYASTFDDVERSYRALDFYKKKGKDDSAGSAPKRQKGPGGGAAGASSFKAPPARERGVMWDSFIEGESAGGGASAGVERGLAEEANIEAAEKKCKKKKVLVARRTEVEAEEKLTKNFAPFELKMVNAEPNQKTHCLNAIKLSIRNMREDHNAREFGAGYYPQLKMKTIYSDITDGLKLDADDKHRDLVAALKIKNNPGQHTCQWITKKETDFDEMEARVMVINSLGCGEISGGAVTELVKELAYFVILKPDKAQLFRDKSTYHKLLALQYDYRILGPELEKFSPNPEKLLKHLKGDIMTDKLNWVLALHDCDAAKLLQLYQETDKSVMAANSAVIKKLVENSATGRTVLGAFAVTAEQQAIEEASDDKVMELILDKPSLADSDFRAVINDMKVEYGSKEGVSGTVGTKFDNYLCDFVAYHLPGGCKKIEHVVYAALKAREKKRAPLLWWEEKIEAVLKFGPPDGEGEGAEEAGLSSSSSSAVQLACPVAIDQIVADRDELCEAIKFRDTTWMDLSQHLCKKAELMEKDHLLYDIHVSFTRVAEARQIINYVVLDSVKPGNTAEAIRERVATMRSGVDLQFLGLTSFMKGRETHLLMMTGGRSIIRDHCDMFVRPYGEAALSAEEKEFSEVFAKQVCAYHGYDSTAAVAAAVLTAEKTAESATEVTDELQKEMDKLSLCSPLMADAIYQKCQEIVTKLQTISASKSMPSSNKRLLDEVSLVSAVAAKRPKRFGTKQGVLDLFKQEQPKGAEAASGAEEQALGGGGAAASSSTNVGNPS